MRLRTLDQPNLWRPEMTRTQAVIAWMLYFGLAPSTLVFALAFVAFVVGTISPANLTGNTSRDHTKANATNLYTTGD